MPTKTRKTTNKVMVDPTAGLRRLVDQYMHNLLTGTELRTLKPGALRRVVGSDLVIDLVARYDPPDGPDEEDPLPTPGQLRRVLSAYFRNEGKHPRAIVPGRSPVERNIQVVAGLLELDEAALDVLRFIVVLGSRRELAEVVEAFGDVTLPHAAMLMAAAVNRPPDTVLRALEPESRLIRSGLLVSNPNRHVGSLSAKVQVRDEFHDLVLKPGLDRERLVAQFLPASAPPKLTLEDFTHLGDAPLLCRELLRAGLQSRRPGLNVLFHGPTGVGKTELARCITREIGAELYAAGVADEDGEDIKPQRRLASLLLGQRLLAAEQSVLLFDEVEDLFTFSWSWVFAGQATPVMSKQWFNDLLERNRIPTIWISNRVQGIDPAFLRRFAYVVEFKGPGVRQRRRLIGARVGPEELTESDVEAVAQRFEVSPAQLDSAIASARTLAPDGKAARATIEKLLAPAHRLATGRDAMRQAFFDASRYRIDVLNASEDLLTVARQLEGWRPSSAPGVTLCLYGRPGTGKSEFAKFLAWRMGRRVVYRRGSDLLGMYVGENEKNIARAFREAEEDDALLLFDEVDTFLRDRRQANQQWELSLVNEFLQQLENFRGVLVCTTNLRDGLDEASLRRFAFKVEFGFLRPEQAMRLFAEALPGPMGDEEQGLVARELQRMTMLAPGDFAAVSRRAAALRLAMTPTSLLEALRRECEVKGVGGRRVGF